MREGRCLHCGKPFKGRLGRIYCNAVCRSRHHNEIYRDRRAEKAGPIRKYRKKSKPPKATLKD